VATEADITIRVRAFARAREVLGDAIIVRLPVAATPATLWEGLRLRYTELEPMTSGMRFAINGAICTDLNVRLKDDDEVSLLPPVGGG
jgi:molybdopterin converting factor small subunit